MSIASKSAFGFIGQMYMLAIGLVMTIVVARLLGPEGKGVIAVVAAITSFTLGLGSLGLPGAFSFLAGKNRFPRTDLFWSMVSWSLMLGAAVSLILWVFRGILLGSIFKGLTTLELAVFLASLPSTYFIAFAGQAYMGYGRVVILVFLQSLVATLNLVAVLVSILILHAGTVGAVVALSAVTVTGSILYLIPFGSVGWISLRQLRLVASEAIPYGLRVYVGGATQMFSLRADVFFLNLFAGPAVVGVYSVATNLAEKIWLLSAPLSSAVYSLIAGSERKDAARLTITTSRASVVIEGLSALGLLVLSIPLVPIIYGQQFASATIYLAVLLPGTVALAVGGAFYTYYVAQLGRPAVTSALAVASAAVSAVLYVVLIPRIGALGASIGSTVSYSVSLIAFAYLFPRETGYRVSEMLVPGRGDWDLYVSILRRVTARMREIVLS